ncbi:V-set and immunoglobulin domain-containing protein 10-like isoform X3 [Microcaecilia unicolor]|uniref:V-set and immunoglobulin domain-containing protein 10-like isoform X3 n=1 Tax=Microcaecilia unicolor TaxID=1415580 RepID=UPI001185546C|nr:V-set and immunoglobulin domain-containing protein 10-like isoform X3 [Microcaecilia unicolor]
MLIVFNVATGSAVFLWTLLLAAVHKADGVTITVQDQPLNFLTGDTITINITVSTASALLSILWTKDLKTIVFWRKNATDIDDLYKDRLSIFESGSINISNALISDSATYRVRVDAMGETTAEQNFTVHVFEKVESVRVEISPEEVLELASNLVNLDCVVGSGTGQVTWTKDGQTLPQTGSQIQIRSPVRSDAGIYTCTMTNPLSSGCGNKTLTVYYGPDPPSITITSDRDPNTYHYVHLNSNVNLTCSTDSKPPATYSWVENNGGNLPVGSILTKPNIQLTQAGQYFCIVSNSKTGIRLSQPINIAIYGDLACSLDAIRDNSALRFRCSWPGGPVPVRLHFLELSGAEVESYLEQNVTALAGLSGKMMTCVGGNPFVSQNCSITPEAPSNLSTSITAFEEVSGSLTIHILGRGKFNPVAAQWLKGTSQLMSGGRYQLNDDSTQLTISNFTLEQDLGNYTFLCSNPLGKQNKTLEVIAPSVSSLSVTRSTDSMSANLYWTVPEGAVITRFQVQMQGPLLSRAADDWQLLQNVSSADHSYTVSGLQPTRMYTFRVVPKMGRTSGLPSELQTLTPVSSQGLSAGAIAGIVVGSIAGSLLLIFILILLICCIWKQKSK